LVERALNLGSRDNISVLIVLFERAKPDRKGGKAKSSSNLAAAHGGRAAAPAAPPASGEGAGAAATVPPPPPAAAAAVTVAAADVLEHGEGDLPFSAVGVEWDDPEDGVVGFEGGSGGGGRWASHQHADGELVEIVAEAVAYSAIERAVASMLGGGDHRFTRRDTVTEAPSGV
jgi:hypothetical protein